MRPMHFAGFWRFGFAIRRSSDGKWSVNGNWHPFSLSVIQWKEDDMWALNLIFFCWSMWICLDLGPRGGEIPVEHEIAPIEYESVSPAQIRKNEVFLHKGERMRLLDRDAATGVHYVELLDRKPSIPGARSRGTVRWPGKQMESKFLQRIVR